MIRLIKSFLRYRRAYGFLYRDPEWEQADRAAWGSFLRTETGRKLVEKWRHAEGELMIAAAESDPADTIHAAGRASGCRAIVCHLLELSAPGEPQSPDNTADTDQGDPELRERYSP